MSSEASRSRRFGLPAFIVAAVCLLLLRLVLPAIQVSPTTAAWISLAVTVLFVGLPILAMFWAADHPWSPKFAGLFVLIGLVLHIGAFLIARQVESPFARHFCLSTANLGLMVWTVGLGAFLASIIGDRNLLLPMAAFLAGFDMWLVFSPVGVVQQVVTRAPEAFKAATYAVPTVGRVEPIAQIGPADFLFLAMFFVALFRFGMRTRETLRWVIPVLLAYLFVVIFLGGVSIGPISLGMLPALVPIGLTLLWVNRKEFHLTPSEKQATWVVVAIAVAFAGFGLWQAIQAWKNPPTPPPGPSSSASAPAAR